MSYDQTTTDLVRSIVQRLPFDAYAIAVQDASGAGAIRVENFAENTGNAEVAAKIGRRPTGEMRPYAAGWRMREIETGTTPAEQRYSVGVAGSQRWIFVLDGAGNLLRETPVDDSTDPAVTAAVYLDL